MVRSYITIFVSLLFLKQLIRSNPDVEWWSHILSWNSTYGSGAGGFIICLSFLLIFVHFVVMYLFGVLSLLFLGARSWWSGWMIDFLLAGKWELIIR